jgi:hypothetical protein
MPVRSLSYSPTAERRRIMTNAVQTPTTPPPTAFNLSNLHSPARFPSTDTFRRVAHVHPGRPADHAEHRPHETTVHDCTDNPGDSASSAGDKESTD